MDKFRIVFSRFAVRRIIPVGIFLFSLPALSAVGDYPEASKQAYVDRCGASMHSQGLPLEKARGFCRCMIDAQEIEFGRREYDAMMQAEPNPNGSNIDRRLYRVTNGCRNKVLQ